MQEHKDKGLHYNWDKKNYSGHKCKNKFFFVLTQDDCEGSMDLPSATMDTSVDLTDFHDPPPVKGALAVLGIQWLTKSGLLRDYSALTM